VLAFGAGCGERFTLEECVPSNDAFYGVAAGCEELQFCLTQDYIRASNGDERPAGKPSSTLRWDDGKMVEECADLWCEGRLASAAEEICP